MTPPVAPSSGRAAAASPAPASAARPLPFLAQFWWLLAALVAVGWGLGESAGERAFTFFGNDKSVLLGYVAEATFWVLSAIIESLSVMAALGLARLSIGRPRLLLLVPAGAMASAVGWGVSVAISQSADWALGQWFGLALAGLLGGLALLAILSGRVRWGAEWQPVLVVFGLIVALEANFVLVNQVDFGLSRFWAGTLAGAVAGVALFLALNRATNLPALSAGSR